MRFVLYALGVIFLIGGLDYLKSFDPRNLDEKAPPNVASAHAAGVVAGALLLLGSCVLFAGGVIAGRIGRRRRPRRRGRKAGGMWELAEPPQGPGPASDADAPSTGPYRLN